MLFTKLTTYFPIQNFENILPSISSFEISPGWTWFGDQDGLTGNFSIGVNHWLSESFGIMLMSEYKHNLDNIEEDVMLDEGGTMRWSLMFMIKLGKED